MKVCFYLNTLSPHQLPLAISVREKIGVGNFLYVYRDTLTAERHALGWGVDEIPNWCVRGNESTTDLLHADIVYTGIRCLALMEKRALSRKWTLYYSERWFKPLLLFGSGRYGLPGWVRLISPSYRQMVKRFVLWANKDPRARVLAVGPWAKKDFLRMGVEEKKIVDWGYFVTSGAKLRVSSDRSSVSNGRHLKVLWVGRMLGWKRVDTLIRAVASVPEVELTLVGIGPERFRLEKLVQSLLPEQISRIAFHDAVPIDQVRDLMRTHDVYVLPSNGYEGWGAVVSEALEEGMNVIGTYEAGSSAAILPKERLYHAGDVKALARLLELECVESLPPCSIDGWSTKDAVKKLLELI